MELILEIPYQEIKRRLGTLQSRTGHVIARAANRTIATGKKVIKEETVKVYRVKKKDVAKVLSVERATAQIPHVHFAFRDTHQNLARFSSVKSTLTPRTPVISSDPTNPNPAYYKAKIMQGGHAMALKDDPKPFVQFAGENKEAILLQRESKSARAPLRGVAAPAMPQILKNEKVMERFERETTDKFQERLEHEIDQVLKGNVY